MEEAKEHLWDLFGIDHGLPTTLNHIRDLACKNGLFHQKSLERVDAFCASTDLSWLELKPTVSGHSSLLRSQHGFEIQMSCTLPVAFSSARQG